MNGWRWHRLAAVGIAWGWYAAVGTSNAQQAGELNVDVGDCVKLEAPEQRLACFEARVRAAQQRRAPTSAETPPPVEAPAPAASNRAAEPPRAEREAPRRQARRDTERPEARPAEAERPDARPASAAAPRPAARAAETASAKPPRESRHAAAVEAREARADTDEIVSRVQSLRETVPNAYLITLENGQVWRQMRPQVYPLRPGQDVRIYGTRWGTASRLTADELKSYIQVERVQ